MTRQRIVALCFFGAFSLAIAASAQILDQFTNLKLLDLVSPSSGRPSCPGVDNSWQVTSRLSCYMHGTR